MLDETVDPGAVRCARCWSQRVAGDDASRCAACNGPRTQPAPTDRLSADHTCRACRHSLRGVRLDGRCPECGVGVSVSLAPDRLMWEPPARLESLRRWVGFVTLAILAWPMLVLLAGVAQFFVERYAPPQAETTLDIVVAIFGTGTILLAGHVAWAVLLVHCGRLGPPRVPRTILALLAATLGLTLAWSGVWLWFITDQTMHAGSGMRRMFGNDWEAEQRAAEVFWLVAFIGFVGRATLGCALFGEIARRAHDSRLARVMPVGAALGAATIALAPLAPDLLELGMVYEAPGLGVAIGVFVAGVLLMLCTPGLVVLAYFAGLIGIRREIGEVAQSARESSGSPSGSSPEPAREEGT